MKKQFMPFVSARKHVKSLAAVLTFVFISNYAFAQSAGSAAASEQPVMVSHIGTLDDKMYLQVHFANDSSDRFVFTIRDEQGTVLFRELSSDKLFNKKFQLSRLSDGERLTFNFYTPKDKKTQSFEVNARTSLVDDVVVTKLK